MKRLNVSITLFCDYDVHFRNRFWKISQEWRPAERRPQLWRDFYFINQIRTDRIFSSAALQGTSLFGQDPLQNAGKKLTTVKCVTKVSPFVKLPLISIVFAICVWLLQRWTWSLSRSLHQTTRTKYTNDEHHQDLWLHQFTWGNNSLTYQRK